MGYDLLGFGTNAPNVVTARQADDRVIGAADTFAKDCTTPDAGDGTGIKAAWGVGLLQQLRALIRGNGQTLAAVDVVTQDNSDDTMALKAIQHLIQRGQPRFAIDTGAANALSIALVPALAEYKFGFSIDVVVAHNNTAAATINVNALGPRDIIRNDSTPLQPGDLRINSIVTLKYNGVSFQLDVPAGTPYAVDTGGANALLVTLAPPLVAYVAGLSINVVVGHDNTGPATINVNALGVKTIIRNDGTPLQPRDLPINSIVTLKYNGGSFQIDVPSGFSNAAQIVTASANIVLTLQQRAICLLRTVAPAAMIITLPTSARNGATVVIEDGTGNLSTAAVTVTPTGGETIAGAGTYVMNHDFQSTTFRLYDNGVVRVWTRSS